MFDTLSFVVANRGTKDTTRHVKWGGQKMTLRYKNICSGKKNKISKNTLKTLGKSSGIFRTEVASQSYKFWLVVFFRSHISLRRIFGQIIKCSSSSFADSYDTWRKYRLYVITFEIFFVKPWKRSKKVVSIGCVCVSKMRLFGEMDMFCCRRSMFSELTSIEKCFLVVWRE